MGRATVSLGGLRKGAITLALGAWLAVTSVAGTPAAQTDSRACPTAGLDQPVSHVTAPGRVALTFDEPLGPDTRTILRTLRRHHVRATFFLVGREAQLRPGLAHRIVRRHETGNHSFGHVDLSEQADSGRSQMRRANRVIRGATGQRPCLLRPPFGNWNSGLLEAASDLELKTVLWDVSAAEWKGGDVAQRVLDGCAPDRSSCCINCR